MTFTITVYGAGHDELSDEEKEFLAERIHRALQETHDVHPDSVGIEGYMQGVGEE